MKTFFRSILLITLSLVIPVCCAEYSDRNEIRSAYRAIIQKDPGYPLSEMPDLNRFTTPGSLSEGAQTKALDYLNFLRSLAGLDNVSLNSLYSLRCQNACALLAANDVLSHTPEKATNMSDDQYDSAYYGASMSCISSFNWFSDDILTDGILYFSRDDGDDNLSILSHRRWILDPSMASTGLGLACSKEGNTYIAVYAADCSKTADWDYICWPCGGLFPADLMRSSLAWSVSVNDDTYSVMADDIFVELTEQASGLHFVFNESDNSDGFFNVSYENCGSGPCIIFRPDSDKFSLNGYEQNQVWNVHIGGLRLIDETPVSLDYTVNMISLIEIDPVNIEISSQSESLSIGSVVQLSAAVIPAYADDLSVIWSSSDESIATVDQNGNVTALLTGTCEIISSSSNEKQDRCIVTVY